MTNLTGYRTYMAAALMAVFGALAHFDWLTFMGNPKGSVVALMAAIVMAAMRSITTTPPKVGLAAPEPVEHKVDDEDAVDHDVDVPMRKAKREK